MTKYWQVAKADRAKFRGAYKRGWNYSDNLNVPEHLGLDGNPFSDFRCDAWEDGYLDRATDREYGHRLTEHNHGDCD